MTPFTVQSKQSAKNVPMIQLQIFIFVFILLSGELKCLEPITYVINKTNYTLKCTNFIGTCIWIHGRKEIDVNTREDEIPWPAELKGVAKIWYRVYKHNHINLKLLGVIEKRNYLKDYKKDLLFNRIEFERNDEI